MPAILTVLFSLILIGGLFSWGIVSFFQRKVGKGVLMLLLAVVAGVLFIWGVNTGVLPVPDKPVRFD